MSKSILVIDTPKNWCNDCIFAIYHDGKSSCYQSQYLDVTQYHNVGSDRHPQCPLQPTDELLEALEEIKRHSSDNSVKVRTSYNKLYKALGGKVDDTE